LGAFVAWTSYRRWEDNERAMRLGEPLPPSNLPRVLRPVLAIRRVAAVIALFGSKS
jgi:putative membrane protein